MLPAFVRITLLSWPGQFHNGELPVRHRYRRVKFEQADRATVNDILRQQFSALLKATPPAFGGGILVAAQRDVIGLKRRDIQPETGGKFCERLSEAR